MSYFGRRLLSVIPVIAFTWTLVFVVMQLIPGDPVNLMLAGVPASEEVRQRERERLGLDRPVLERYAGFLVRAAKGDLGDSFRSRRPVTEMIAEQMGPTIQLAFGGLLVGLVSGGAGGRRRNQAQQLGRQRLHGIGAGRRLAAEFLDRHDADLCLRHAPDVGPHHGARARCAYSSLDHRRTFHRGRFRPARPLLDHRGDVAGFVRTARAKGLSPAKVVLKHACAMR